MPFIYESRIGEQRFITSKSLKRKLITFSGDEYDDSNVPDVNPTEAVDILEFFEKIGIDAPRTLNYDEVQTLIEVNFRNHMEEMPVLLTMERVHFMSIVYLLKENLANIDEIVKMLNMPFYSRTEYLLKYLSRETTTTIQTDQTFSGFYDIINLIDSTNGRSNGFDRERIISRSSGKFELPIPSAEISISGLEKRAYLSTVVRKFDALDSLPGLVTPLFSNEVWWDRTLLYDNEINLDYGEPDDIIENNDSFLSRLYFNSDVVGTVIKYNSTKFMEGYLSTLLPQYLRTSFIRRNQSSNDNQSDRLFLNNSRYYYYNNIKPPRMIELDTIPIFKNALALDESYTLIPYGTYLRASYFNTNDYFSDIDATLSIIDFTDFEFIADDKVKSLMNKIFPTISVNTGRTHQSAGYTVPIPLYDNYTLSDPEYITSYFMKRVGFDGTDITGYYDRHLYNKDIDASRNKIPTILQNLDMVVKNSSKTVDSNPMYKLDYINAAYIPKFKEIFTRVLDESLIPALDLDADDLSWNTAETTSILGYLESIQGLIPTMRTEIAAYDNYEFSISLSMYIDIFDNYINWLKDSDTYKFVNIGYVSEESYQNYRIINFTQQTFKGVAQFHSNLTTLKYYDLYLLLFGLYSEDISTGPDGATTGSKYFYDYTVADHVNRDQVKDLI